MPAADPDAADPAARLMACHERIRRFSAGLLRLIDPQADPRQVQDAAARCARYFGEALPLHALDEDESLAPRLAGRAPAAALARMGAEHGPVEEGARAVVAALERLARGDDPAALAALRALAPPFVEGLLAHIALEEAQVFPHIQGLDEATRAEVVAEMYARRGVRGPDRR